MGHFGYALVIGRPTGEMLYVNEAWSTITGVPLEEIPLRPFGSQLAPEYVDAAVDRNARRVAGLPVEELYESAIINAEGATVPLEVGVRWAELDGAPALVSFMQDISARKHHEEMIALYQRTVDAMPLGIGVWHLPPGATDSGSMILVGGNEAGAAIVAVDLQWAIGQPLREVLPELLGTALGDAYLEVATTGVATNVSEFRYRMAATGDAFYDVRIFPLPGNHIGTVFEEITARHVAGLERRQLLRRIVSVEEATRQRLAEELHDDPIQVLTALNLRLGMLRRKAEQLGVDLDFEPVEQLAGGTIDSLRRILFELLPPGLAAGSLLAAVRTQAAQLRADADVEVTVDVGDVGDVAPEVVAAAYRIVQEALANVRRHAQARRASVRIVVDEELEIEVVDDGVGITTDTLPDAPGHIGLRSMRERARGLGGWCVVERAPDGGTRARAALPLSDPGGD